VTAKEYIINKLKWSLANTDLLAVRMVFEAAKSGDLKRITEVEDMLEASRLPAEQRDGSKKMGSRFAKTVEKLDLEDCREGIFREYIQSRKGKVINHCCVYGVFCGAERDAGGHAGFVVGLGGIRPPALRTGC
jgi:urease accessory protein